MTPPRLCGEVDLAPGAGEGFRGFVSAPHRGLGWGGGGGDKEFGGAEDGPEGSTSLGFPSGMAEGLRTLRLMTLTLGASLDSEPKLVVDSIPRGLDAVGRTDLMDAEAWPL